MKYGAAEPPHSPPSACAPLAALCLLPLGCACVLGRRAGHCSASAMAQRSYAKALPGVDRSKAAKIYIDGYYKKLLDEREQRQKRCGLVRARAALTRAQAGAA